MIEYPKSKFILWNHPLHGAAIFYSLRQIVFTRTSVTWKIKRKTMKMNLFYFQSIVQRCALCYETYNNNSYLVRIAVGGWSTIFQISTFILSYSPRNTNRASSVGNPSTEIMDGWGFMKSRQPSFVVFSFVRIVGLDVTNVMPGKLVDGALNLS